MEEVEQAVEDIRLSISQLEPDLFIVIYEKEREVRIINMCIYI